MEKYFILYNPLSGEQEGELIAQSLDVVMEHVMGMADITKITNYKAFLSDKQDYSLIIVGGDGTLHRFANDTKGLDLENKIFFYPAGNENKFLLDRDSYRTDMPVEITKYLKEIPECVVKGKKHLYINNVVWGTGNWRELIFQYQPVDVKINMDGEEKNYKKVWNITVAREPKEGVYIFQGSRWNTIKNLKKLAKGMEPEQEIGTFFLPVHRSFDIETEEEKICQIDGEMIGNTDYIRICMKGACK